jgi:oligopeptide/dipeptide ABC transporter ATP-binding protein
MTTTSRTTVLEVSDLCVTFPGRTVDTRAVDHVSFTMRQGEIVGLVGESACGKSTLGLSILNMVPDPGLIVSGSVLFEDNDLAAMSESQLRQVRGNDISLIVQDALATMNPVTRVQEQVSEIIRDHEGGRARKLRSRVLDMLSRVHLPNPDQQLTRYPHQLSGGMQQRVSIAQGLILGPRLIVADEPTTALDVTVQAQILTLLRQACEEHGASILFITHDLATVAEICERVLVMYAGRIVESGPVVEVFERPRHPYTAALLKGLLPLDGSRPDRLEALAGQPPRPEEWPQGCRFHPRCPLRERLGSPAICSEQSPRVDESQGHWGACHFTDEVA